MNKNKIARKQILLIILIITALLKVATACYFDYIYYLPPPPDYEIDILYLYWANFSIYVIVFDFIVFICILVITQKDWVVVKLLAFCQLPLSFVLWMISMAYVF